MSKAPPFVIENGIAKGTLKRGLTIGETTHTEFEMREYDVGDLLDAETETSVTSVLNFNAQLMTRQLIRVGTFKGPFTVNQLRKLSALDWRILRAAQGALESLGEDEPAANETS